MSKKAAIQLSANFLVMIIISIVVFGFGLYLAKSIMGGSEDIANDSFDELDRGLGKLACISGERICLNVKEKSIQRGEFKKFALTIENIVQTEDFTVNIYQTKAVDDNNQIISGAPTLGVLPTTRDLTIPLKGSRSMGVGIEVPDNAPSGRYIFDIQVSAGGSSYHPGRSYKFYVKVI